MKYRKILIPLVAVLLGAVTAQAQKLYPKANEKGKFGYVDEGGKVIVPYQLQEAQPFKNGLARIRKGDKYGFIDETGKLVVKPKYTVVKPFEGNLSMVAVGGSISKGVLKGAKWGFINEVGKEVVPAVFEWIGTFKNGVVPVMKGKKYGLVNADGQPLVQPKYAAVGSFNAQGYCWVCAGGKVGKDGKIYGKGYGVINREGKVIIPPKFSLVGTFFVRGEEGKGDFVSATDCWLYAYNNKQDWMYTAFSEMPYSSSPYLWFSKKVVGMKPGVVNQNGMIVVPENMFGTVCAPTDGMAKVTTKRKKKVYYGFYNIETKKLMQLEDTDNITYGAYNCSLSKVTTKDGIYFMDKSGKKVTETYAKAFGFQEGLCPVMNKKGLCGVIDTEGKVAIPFEYAEIAKAFADGLLGVQKYNAGWGYVDKQGQQVIPCQYSQYNDFKFGWAGVVKDNQWGIIDKTGNVVLPFQWDNLKVVEEAGQRYIWGRKNGAWFCYDRKNGKKAFERGFTDVTNFSNNFAFVQDGKGFGVINESGTEIIPCTSQNIAGAQKVIDYMRWHHKEYMNATDMYRYYIYLNPETNNYKLTDQIPDSSWDY